jgi:hypothetical protein
MKILHRLTSVFDWIVHRSKAEAQLDDELQAFLEMSVAEKIAGGSTPTEARRLALIELGGVEQVKERVRTSRHGGGLDEIWRDARYAARLFIKNRGFTCTVVLTLALSIGANTAIFTLIDALMLRWLPVRNPQELVQVWFQSPGSNQTGQREFFYRSCAPWRISAITSAVSPVSVVCRSTWERPVRSAVSPVPW